MPMWIEAARISMWLPAKMYVSPVTFMLNEILFVSLKFREGFFMVFVYFVGINNINVLLQVTALLGKTAYLNCRVKNLGNKTVSIYRQGLQQC